MHIVNRLAVVAAIGALTACGEPIPPTATPDPSLAVSGATSCPANPTVVVSDEAALTAALSAASAGDVVALEGMIAVTRDVTIDASITLTCATPGSGLAVAPGAAVSSLVMVLAASVTVEGLVLDGSGALGDPYLALNDPTDVDADGVTGSATDVRLTHNSVRCNAIDCAFFFATANAVVSDNEFRSAGSVTGVHLQGGIDGSRVERNTIVATAPSGAVTFGAIRMRDGANVAIVDNLVSGPWSNGLALADLADSPIERNQLLGARFYGIRARSGGSFLPVSMTHNSFRNNRVTGSGLAGLFLTSACGNDLVGNNLQGNADDVGAIFDPATGANVLIGNQNAVIDDGLPLDCDGDGVGDPNIISGPGRVFRGAPFITLPETGAEGVSRLR